LTEINPVSFLYEERGPIAWITLNRPDRLNALTFEVYSELAETMERLERRNEVRVVVISGSGKGFCSGGDVNDIIGELFSRDIMGLREFTRLTCDLVLRIRSIHKPVIASINGMAAGAGAVIALASDIRIAADSARIAFLFVKVGLAGADMGAGFLLPRVVGFGKATELLFGGDSMTAEEAARIGLFNKVVPGHKLEEETLRWAGRLAAGPSMAIGMTKAALNTELGMDLHKALQAEAETQAICMLGPDFKEAYQAFVEKRAPIFNQSRDSVAPGGTSSEEAAEQ
jgi:enoyl-CoA hydratase/carnithine racemase